MRVLQGESKLEKASATYCPYIQNFRPSAFNFSESLKIHAVWYCCQEKRRFPINGLWTFDVDRAIQPHQLTTVENAVTHRDRVALMMRDSILNSKYYLTCFVPIHTISPILRYLTYFYVSVVNVFPGGSSSVSFSNHSQMGIRSIKCFTVNLCNSQATNLFLCSVLGVRRFKVSQQSFHKSRCFAICQCFKEFHRFY